MKLEEYNKLTKQEQLKVKFKDKPIAFKIFLYALILIFFIVCYSMCSKCTDSISQTTPNNGIDSISLYYYSREYAKEFVKSGLKSPSSAEFQDKNIHIRLMPDSTVFIKGTVDAQNSFGSMLRNEFNIEMKWKKDYKQQENWQVLNIELE